MRDTIVLVEDSPDDAELTRLALERIGKNARVVHLMDGAAALEWLLSESRSDAVRFVILDVNLPKLNGPQVLVRLRADPRTRMLPVVMLTSSNSDTDVRSSYESGVNGYVVKPADLNRYLASVATLGTYWDDVNHPVPAR